MLSAYPYFDSIKGRLADMQSGFFSAEMRVVRGPHQGARHAVGATPLSIGSGLDNDIVLLAECSAQSHLQIKLAGAFLQRLHIEAIDAPVAIEGFGILQPGYKVELDLPVCVEIGESALSIRSLMPIGWPAISKGRAAAGLALLLGLGAFASSGPLWTEARATSPKEYRAAQSRKAVAAEPASTRVQAMLVTAGLGDRITVSETGRNITLKGRVEGPVAVAAWRKILMALDGDATMPLIQNGVEVVNTAQRGPSFASVWLGQRPRVVAKDGRSYRVGEQTGDGWTIESIDRDAVILRSQSQEKLRIELAAG